jgi:ADP-heptose:LPS heptosyltransferase
MEKSKKKISCIIPAYNEAKSIRRVLEEAAKVSDLHEIIVIDDGSSDETQMIVRSFSNVKLLINEKNRGKSKTIARGIKEASGEYVLFLDADLIGIADHNISALIEHVETDEADVSISMRGNTPGWMKKMNLDFMSGERVFPRSILLGHIDEIASLKSFGLEVFLNTLIIKYNLRVKSVMLANVRNDMKYFKRGFVRGAYGELLLWRDIFKTVPFFKLVRDVKKVCKLVIKDEKFKSKAKKINFEYLRVWQEIFIASALVLSRKKRSDVKNNKILIVVPCLIGEFIASIPALYDFIKRNNNKQVDLLVSPSVKSLARKISGAGEVFTASSVHGRHSMESGAKQDLGEYEKIIVLRMSREAREMIKKIKHGKLETALPHAPKYISHLALSLLTGRHPKRWKTLKFEILGGKDRNISFDEIFDLKEKKILTGKKTIVFHTGTNWPMKHWDLERWADLLEKINKLGEFKFICVGGREDEKNWEYISSHTSFEMESLINKIDIADLALVLQKADFFIGIDSGPANIAHLTDTRSVVLYGPGPHMFMSDHPDDIAIDKSGGRGLWHMYFSVKNSYISRISVGEVLEAFQKLQAKGKKKADQV